MTDITKEVNELLENHGDEDVWAMQETSKTACMVAGGFSDLHKEVYGIRPRFNLTVAECLESIKSLQDELEYVQKEEERIRVENDKRDKIPLEGIFIDGKPVRPIDWRNQY